MTLIPKPCNERSCALSGDYIINIQSEDGATMFAGLQVLIEERAFNAHLHMGDGLWGALVPLDELAVAERLSEKLAEVAPRMRHWVRMMVEDERRHLIVFDRTYHADGEMREPIPG